MPTLAHCMKKHGLTKGDGVYEAILSDVKSLIGEDFNPRRKTSPSDAKEIASFLVDDEIPRLTKKIADIHKQVLAKGVKADLPSVETVTSSSETAKTDKKQPWEMTRKEYNRYGANMYLAGGEPRKQISEYEKWFYDRNPGLYGESKRYSDRPVHKAIVKYAISEGKNVPLGIIEEYKGEPWADKALKQGVKHAKKAGTDTEKGRKEKGTEGKKKRPVRVRGAEKDSGVEAGKVAAKEDISITGKKEKTVSVDMAKAKEDSLSPREQKKYLMAEIDKAIEAAPEGEFYQTKKITWNTSRSDADKIIEKGIQAYNYANDKYGTITIEVPGDGEFTVINSKGYLREFKKRAKRFPITDKTKTKSAVTKPKRSNKRFSGEGIEYYNEFSPRKERISTKAETAFYKDGYFSDGAITIKTKTKPKVGKRTKYSDSAPDFKAMFKDFAKSLSPAKIVGEFLSADYPDMPLVHVVSDDGKHYQYQATYVDQILTAYPKAKIYVSPSGFLTFKNGNVYVGAIAPFGKIGDITNLLKTAQQGYNAKQAKSPLKGYSESHPEWATRYEDSSGGKIVYSTDKVALLEGFSIITGKPVYLGVNKSKGVTRIDIEHFTGKIFSAKEKSALIAAKKEHKKKQAALHKKHPNGPFKGQVSSSKGVDKKVESVASEWLKMLGISERVFLTTQEDVKDAEKYKLYGPYAAIRSAQLTRDKDGSMRMLSNGDYYIIIGERENLESTLEVLAHEIGHILEKTKWGNAPKMVKKAIIDDYREWAEKASKTKPKEWVESMRAYHSTKVTGIDNIATADQLPPYWRSFSEWFADQVARWATSNKKPLSAVERFFKAISDGLKKLYASAAGKRYLPYKSMSEYLNGLTPEYSIAPAKYQLKEKQNATETGQRNETKSIGKEDETKRLQETLGADTKIVQPKNGREKAISGIVESLGYKVRIIETSAAVNGLMFKDAPGTIYLNRNASRPMLAVAGHELVHALQKTSPDLFNFLRDTLEKRLTNFDDWLKKYNDRRIAAGFEPISEEQAREELYADFVGDSLIDGRVWNSMLNENPTMARKIAEHLKLLFERIMRAIKKYSPKSYKYFTDIETAHKIIGQVFAAAGERVSGEKAFEFAQPSMDISEAEKKITDNPNFKEWFGDSKVVDENGEPLVVYHGTSGRDFNSFDANNEYNAVFFTDEPSVANSYSGKGTTPALRNKMGFISAYEGKRTYPVFLSMQNPLIIENISDSYNDFDQTRDIRKAIRNGHDGIIFRNIQDTEYYDPLAIGSDVYAVFDPTQIKSIFNRGTFDSGNPDIRYQIGDNPEKEFQKAGDVVDGRKVLKDVPNTSSISATFTNYTELDGIREIPMDGWYASAGDMFYAKDDFDRVKDLTNKIRESKKISPLIVAIDSDGPYILEGAHRLAALESLGAKSFPAKVVIDEDSVKYDLKYLNKMIENPKPQPLFQIKDIQENANKAMKALMLDPEMIAKKGRKFGAIPISNKVMSLARRITAIPHFLAKDNPSVKKLVDAALSSIKDRQRAIFNDANSVKSVIDLKGDDYNYWKQLILHADAEGSNGKDIFGEFGESIETESDQWLRKNNLKEDSLTEEQQKEFDEIVKTDKLIVNDDKYKAVEKFLLDRGFKENIVKAFIDTRKMLDGMFIRIDRFMNDNGAERSDIEEYRRNVKKLHNYFPHKRYGSISINIADPEDPSKMIYSEGIPSVFGINLRGSKKDLTKRAIEWAHDNGYKKVTADNVFFAKRKQLPDQVFFNLDIQAMSQIITQAAERAEKEGRGIIPGTEALKDISLAGEINKRMFKAVADEIKLRGFGEHLVNRKNIPGFETQDLKRVLMDYTIGANGMMEKAKLARTLGSIMNKLGPDGKPLFDAKRDPETFKWASNYVKDMLTNKDQIDTAVDNIRGLFFMKYLGGVIKTAALNLTQNMVSAWPRLTVWDFETNKPEQIRWAGRELGRAMRDIKKALIDVKHTGKYLKSLSENEQKLLNDMLESGINMDQFLTELRGATRMQNPMVGKVMGALGLPMQMAEKYNRASTALAAYRIADKKLRNKYGDKIRHEKAAQWAETVVADSQFLYGKVNAPEFVRGSSLAKFIRPLYTFRTFTHNYAEMMRFLVKQGWVGQKAAMKSIGSLFALGGLMALPFYDTWDDAYEKLFGEKPATAARKAIDNDLLRDLMTYGVLGTMGVDLHGSLGIDIPKSFTDILGVPYAVFEDAGKTATDVKMGQYIRALEDSPVTPMVMRNAISGYRQYKKGAYTRTGRPIGDLLGGTEEPRKLSTKDFVLKSLLGFQPIKTSKAYQAYSDLSEKIQDFNDMRTSLATKYVEAKRAGDKKKINRILRRVREWNDDVRAKGKPELIINISRMIKSRETSKKPPKAFRGEAKKLMDVWK